jgi:acyl-CoA synthetase (AMP-forming)/AMP-acid ligase II
MGAADFGALGEAARGRCASIEHLLQFAPPGERIAKAIGFPDLLASAGAKTAGSFPMIAERDPAQVIFTTGSTGSSKPAILSHRGIACQNLCLARAFDFGPGHRVLCNLPASHVGGQAELLITTLFSGATAVTLEVFDPARSLDAIERYGVTLIGQIPAMFQMEWRTADYASRNLGSLRTAVYGGQSAPRAFLEQMRRMAPRIATGLGLTEASGFCTYTPLTPDIDAVAQGVGWAMPAYRMSIRQAMNGDGSAGTGLPQGEIGHVCFQGPQTFLGYLNDAGATAAALSSDGWLYTGDMGRLDEHGLHLAGRAKWVLKPAGYQVFPGDVEAHIAALADLVANVGVVGHPHPIWSEAIIAFVEKRPGAELTEAALRRHARSLTSYMRPLHYVIMEPGAMPLNRSAKVDIIRLQELAKEEVRKLRERGRWDACGN